MKLLTAEEMRELDRRTIEEIGIPGIVLMENAGRGAADLLCRRFAHLLPGPVLVLAGKGNNGGDGYVVARHLLNRGWQVRTVVLAEQEAISGDAGVNLAALLKAEGSVSFAPDEGRLARELGHHGGARLVVDALFGTGLSSEVRGRYGDAIDWINAAGVPVVAIDIPSGIDAGTGRILGRGVRATLTATFAFPKIGQVLYPGAQYTGDLETIDIGIPISLARTVEDRNLLVEATEAGALAAPRPVTGHKGTFGHLLVVAGSAGKSGAAAMTAEGGVRAGAGLVTVACSESVRKVLEIKLTEVMTATLSAKDGGLSTEAFGDIEGLWADKKALAIGPGLGQAEGTREVVRQVVRACPLPLVVDADGLNALTGGVDLLLERGGPTPVLTPHPGEMARLTGGTVADVEADRIGTARAFANRYRVVLVLKGARTVTAFPDGRVRLNGSGNPGMASGGMGDILTGLIGGLLAQGLSPEDAAVLGVYLHGAAGDRLLEHLGDAGMVATDLLQEIPAARRELLKANARI